MSNLSAFPYIRENSAATPGLWNYPLSIISANIAAIDSGLTSSSPSGNTFSFLTNIETSGGAHFQFLSVGSTPPSYVTTAAITVAVNSSQSDYLYLVDSSGQRSSYAIGSRAGGTGDGLNIWDASAGTMIASLSKQSVRFYQKVIAPILDFGTVVHNIQAYGAKGDGITDDTMAIQDAVNAAHGDGGGAVLFSAGTYLISSGISLYNDISLFGYPRFARILNNTAAVDSIKVGASKRVILDGVYVDGNNTNRYGIFVNLGDDIRIYNCWVKSQGSTGIFVNGAPVIINRTVSELNSGHGIEFTGTNSGSPVHIVDNYIYANGLNGVFGYTNGNEAMIIGNEIINNSLCGVRLWNAARHNKIIGNTISGNSTHGIQCDTTCEYNIISANEIKANGNIGVDLTTNSDLCVVSNNGLVDNNQLDSTQTWPAIRLNSVTLPTVTGNMVRNSLNGRYQTYGVIFQGVASALVVGNTFSQLSVGPVQGAPTTAYVGLNQGWVDFETDSGITAPLSSNTLSPQSGNTVLLLAAWSTNTHQATSGTTASWGTYAVSAGTVKGSALSVTNTAQIGSNLTVGGSIEAAGQIVALGSNAAFRLGNDAGSQGQLTLAGGDTYQDYLGTYRLRSITGGTATAVTYSTADTKANFGFGVLVPDGSANNPRLGFASEASLGFWRSGVSVLSLSYGAVQYPDGSSVTPSVGFSSNSSLGFYSSGVQTIAQSYGTLDLTATIASLGTIRVKSGANNSCGTAVLGSNGSVNVANTYVKTGDLIFLTDQTAGGTLGDLEIGGIRNSSGFTILSTSVTDTSTVAWLIIRPG